MAVVRPLAETIALARARHDQDERLSPDAIIARTYARMLFRALSARIGGEIAEIMAESRDGQIIADPTFDAADRLSRRGIMVQPCNRTMFDQPLVFLACWPDGTMRNLTGEELCAMAGVEA